MLAAMHLRSAPIFSALGGLAVALALAACPSSSTKDGTGPGTAAGTEDPGAVGNTGGTTTDAACTTDDDCVVSCARAGDCCDQLCPPCDQVYTRADHDALMAWRDQSCAAASCPIAKCMAPDHENVARCRDGACVIESIPTAAP